MNTKIWKLLTSSILVITILVSSLLPVFSKRAAAQFGIPQIVFDPTHTAATEAEATRKTILDGLNLAARIASQALISRVVNSTIAWANNGFEGNPAYAVNPRQYFTDIADGVAGEFIDGNDQLGFLCSPFQVQVKLALRNSYTQPNRFQCTLTEVVGNIEDFYGDFNQGGWDAWFSMTQNNMGNPYGALIEGKIELNNRLATALSLEREQLNWNQGFKSWGPCTKHEGILTGYDENGEPIVEQGSCIERAEIKTPGSIIKTQLDQSLSAPLQRVINSQEIESLVDAFVLGVLNRYVFGNQGLFN